MDGIGRREWAWAGSLALILGALATWLFWPRLAIGQLPDNDDLMRLAQVRDWLGGQGFRDLAQHRLGGPDWAMHWSRIGDFGPAALIALFAPLFGAKSLIWAVILWPLILFALFLAATAQFASRLAGREAAIVAIVLASLAFPATNMFLPGRIDHHGLQLLFTVLLADAAVAPPSRGSGARAGLLVAASLAIGLETAPQCLAAVTALFALWVRDGAKERDRAASFGLALGGATALWAIIARPTLWMPLCDSFTPASVALALGAGATFLIMGLFSSGGWRRRLAVGVATGIVALAAASPWARVCLAGPYGAVDPLLMRLWMARVEEARGLFAHSPDIVIAFGALPILGTAAAAWHARKGDHGWLILLAMIGAGVAVSLVQIRGSPFAAALAPVALAPFILRARSAKRPLAVVAAWLASLGMVWNVAGAMATPGDARRPDSRAACDDARTIRQLRALPTGTIVAPIDAGAEIIGLTNHRALAAPYHRDNAGNRAAYDFWLSPPARARAIVRSWRIDYVLACPHAFGGIDLNREGPGGMALRLEQGRAPGWLTPIALTGSQATLYRVAP